MTSKSYALITVALGATLMTAQAQTAQTTAKASAAPPAPALSATEQTIKDIKNPTSWLSWGGDLRLRNEYFNNGQSLGSNPTFDPRFATLHAQDYFRYRGRLWASVTPVENLSLNGRLAAEPRQFMESSSFGSYPNRTGMEWRYGIIDNANVQWKQPLDLPATLTVGRQDLFLGDGWLVADGTPADGSWTFFFDAARLTYKIEELKTTIDAIGIVQYARPDAWMPTIGPSTESFPNNYFLTDQNEKGAILWIANKSIPEANLDGYFMYKHDTRVNNTVEGRPGTNARFGDDADIYTVGGRVSGVVKEHWKYSAEGAYQFGEKKDPSLTQSAAGPAAALNYHNISALGANAKLTYLFKDKLNNQVFLAYEFLRGDDPNSGQDEMFDVLWGRWPRWSELYNVYSYIPETRVAQTANLHRFGPGWSLNPIKDMDFSVNYNLMFADQEVPTRAFIPTAFSNNDSFRGHYLQGILKYKFSRHVSGHLWSEFVFPGHFYSVSGQAMTFLRAELLFTF